MTRSMRYRDTRGRHQTLTFAQWVYLRTAEQRGGFERGWGGLDSTLVVRLLRERGLIELDDRRQPWRVTAVTAAGRKVLERWGARS